MLSIFSILITSYLILGLLLFLFQRSVLYFPQPADKNISTPEISFVHEEQELTGWVLNQEKEKAIIYYGGNAESIEQNLPFYLEQLSDSTSYFIPYRGYGNNSGKPTESNLYSDALYIYDQIKSKHKSISIVGRSLGTGVATYVAVNREIDKLVLVTPYDSIENVASGQYPIFPMLILVKDKFLSIERAAKITAKTLVFIAEHDKTIPAKNTVNLIRKFDQKLLTEILIKGSDHNNILEFSEYKKAMQSFLE